MDNELNTNPIQISILWKSSVKNFPRGRTSLLQPCLNPKSSPKPAQKCGVFVQHTNKHTVVEDIKAGFSRGPKPCHWSICPTNRAKKPMTIPLLRPPPLELTIGWKAQGRRRRRRGGAHPHRTACGDLWLVFAVNAGRCCPAGPSDAPVKRQDDIVTKAGAVGAPTYRLCARR